MSAFRFSSELADDEGRVFVAYAPPNPLLVMGRRDPRTGELCVGRWARKPADVPYPDPEDPRISLFEHVTGPEAERLLGEVARALASAPFERFERIGRAYLTALAGRDPESVAIVDLLPVIVAAVPDTNRQEIAEALRWLAHRDHQRRVDRLIWALEKDGATPHKF